MQKVKYINPKNQKIEFGIAPPLILQRIEGTGEVDVSFNTQKSPFQDGKTYIDSKLEPREIVLRTTISTNNSQTLFQLREEVQKIFNPNLGQGALLYTTPNGTKVINAVPDGTPSFSNYKGNSVVCYITLLAFDPFWYDVESVESSYYPVESPINKAVLERGLNTVENYGTAYTPLEIVIKDTDSSITITNEDTGDIIKTSGAVEGGDRLLITTGLGDRKVRIVRWDESWVNKFSYITMDSSFIQLSEGRNQFSLEYSGEGSVELSWKNRYIGL